MCLMSKDVHISQTKVDCQVSISPKAGCLSFEDNYVSSSVQDNSFSFRIIERPRDFASHIQKYQPRNDSIQYFL